MAVFTSPQNLFETVYPFYFVLRFFGLFPKSFDGPVKNGNFILQIKDRLYVAIVVAFYLFMGVASLLDEKTNNLSDSTLLNKAWILNGFMCTIVTVVCVLYGASKAENIRLFLELCCDFDLKVRINIFK